MLESVLFVRKISVYTLRIIRYSIYKRGGELGGFIKFDIINPSSDINANICTALARVQAGRITG